MNLLHSKIQSDEAPRILLFEKSLFLLRTTVFSAFMLQSAGMANTCPSTLQSNVVLPDFQPGHSLIMAKTPAIRFEQLTQRSAQFQKKVELWQKKDPYTYALASQWLGVTARDLMVKKLEQKFQADTGLNWYMVDHLELELRKDPINFSESWHWIVDGHELSKQTIDLLEVSSEQDQAYFMGMRRMFMIESNINDIFEESWNSYEIKQGIKLGNELQKEQTKQMLIGQYMLESYFMENLVGVTQDYGVAQVSPQLAAYHGYETNLNLSVSQSLKIGIDYFISGLARYQGVGFDEKLKLAVIHYNWGPGRVNQIQRKAGNVSADVLIKSNSNGIQRNYLPAVQNRVAWIKQHAQELQNLRVSVKAEIKRTHELFETMQKLLRRKIDLSHGYPSSFPQWFVAYMRNQYRREKSPDHLWSDSAGTMKKKHNMPRWADRFSVIDNPFFPKPTFEIPGH